MRKLRDDCEGAGVGFEMAAWGEWAPYAEVGCGDLTEEEILGDRMAWVTIDGRWSTDCERPESYPIEGTILMTRLGAAVSGRVLDGREYTGEGPK
ncbi:hypothetical protein FRUB_10326 [Fimbriiglobus ruber]|uniref:Uncharacterized protein n=1 Tax=Fimbriiglobus ruber TaxID=1908690 RepID=A0A225DD69_9BACT|nr:hypothetical protein FRUB_10326 [Fimbriiglobus ruber]